MKSISDMSNDEIIDFYYSRAVSGIEESWFKKNGNKDWYNYIINLPHKELITYLIGILDQQVINGGFNQYFVNVYGQFAAVTIVALKIINAKEAVIILELAYKEVNKYGYDDITFGEKLYSGEIEELYEDEDLDDYLESLGDKYSEYPEDIGELLAEFLRT